MSEPPPKPTEPDDPAPPSAPEGAPAPGESPDAHAQPDSDPRRALRVRRWVLVALISGMFLVVGVLLVRGTWADRVPYDPSSPEEGIVTQLLRDGQGRVSVRVAAVVEYPLDAVWEVVTDYGHFPEIFRSELWELKDTQAEGAPDGRRHMTGRVETRFGTFPIDARLLHEATPDRRRVLWDESTGDLELNRGSWTLTPVNDRRTRLVFGLELKIAPYPTVLINNVLLSNLATAIEAVSARLAAQHPK